MQRQFKVILIIIIISLFAPPSFSQFKEKEINWTSDGTAYLEVNNGNIVRNELPSNKQTVVVTQAQLTPKGAAKPLSFSIYEFSPDYKSLLIVTNTAKVWRYNTRGDYWILNIPSNQLFQLGKGLPAQSLMYAKISPDGKFAA